MFLSSLAAYYKLKLEVYHYFQIDKNYDNGQQTTVEQFEGIVNGTIIRERRGGEGFGYDPIFQPEGYNETFAELGNDIKNTISHRARAVAKLADYLNK